MKVYLNQEEIFVGTRASLRDLLIGKSIATSGASVAVNNCIILDDEWKETMLSDGDKVIVIYQNAN